MLRQHVVCASLWACLFAAALSAFAQSPDGAALYARHCARCHEADKTGWSPRREALTKLPPEAILAQLHVGLMTMAATLSDAEKRSGVDLDNSRFQPAEIAGLTVPCE